MKGHLTGVADWEKIKLVREAVGHLVPVIANGNILYHEDVADCIEKTGCVGVMSAEGSLYNPAIFTPGHPESWRLAEEYLTICDELDTKIAYVRGHLFKIFRPSLNVHIDLRSELGLANSREDMWEVTRKLKARLIADEEKFRQNGESFEGRKDEQGFPILPHWVAQPYFRQPMPPQEQKKDENQELETKAETSGSMKRSADESGHRDSEDHTNSAVKSKASNPHNLSEKERNRVKNKKAKYAATKCQSEKPCNNAFSATCSFHRCRGCCRLYQRKIEQYDCPSHGIRSMQKEKPSGLPRVDSNEAIGGVALEGMIVEPSVTSSVESVMEVKEGQEASRCLIL
jgi:tRNA-dihydrouridine synthase 1